MAGMADILAQEKVIGNRAATVLRRSFKNALKATTNVTGESTKATVRSKYRHGRLDRLTFVAPYYQFMQHNGFEGSKKNGISMRLNPTNVLNIAIQESNVLEVLATELAGNRADEVILNMHFNGQQ